jgi:ribose transport system permease protein
VRSASAVARSYGIVVITLLLFVVLAFSSSSFLTTTNLLNILDQSAPLAIAAAGTTAVIIAGGFDLSIGAVFAMSGIVGAYVARDVDPWLGVVVGTAAGAALGFANGGLITWLRINSFLGTLATGLIIRGAAVILTASAIITVTDPSFATLGQQSVAGVPWAVWVLIVVAIALSLLMGRTAFGRYVYAVGGNAEAARLSGVNVNAVRTMVFALGGACAGLAGVLAASRVSTGQADAGTGMELAAIAAVVIGGTSIAGGEGAVWRTLMGVLLLALVQNGFNLLNVDSNYQAIFQGVIIVVAVALEARSSNPPSGGARRRRRSTHSRAATAKEASA